VSTYDPLNTEAYEAARTARAAEDLLVLQTEAADVQWLMGDARGRRVVWRALEQAGVFRLSFDRDAMVMAFAEGRRNEGLRMLALIESAAPESYILMQQEARK